MKKSLVSQILTKGSRCQPRGGHRTTSDDLMIVKKQSVCHFLAEWQQASIAGSLLATSLLFLSSRNKTSRIVSILVIFIASLSCWSWLVPHRESDHVRHTISGLTAPLTLWWPLKPFSCLSLASSTRKQMRHQLGWRKSWAQRVPAEVRGWS